MPVESFLERYEAGEYEPVWAELLAYDEQVQREPLRSEALAVARATMTRVRRNIDVLIPRLMALGYQFEHPLRPTRDEEFAVFNPPTRLSLAQLEDLGRQVGPLPLSLRAWYEVVGGVDFGGRHPAWPRAYPDPLVVYPVWAVLREIEEWREERADHWERERVDVGPFRLEFAPDYYHKANVSGGLPYGVILPDGAADAPVVEEWHQTTFVSYLRIALRWGGFPGFERSQRRPDADLAALTEGLLPI